MSLFEAHITYRGEHRPTVEGECPKGWKFSAITGDPVLGKDSFCYLTSYDADGPTLLARMQEATAAVNAPALRQKIERIVYDTKTNRNELSGGSL